MEGWKIHWKAPLQPKGFIKFIEMFVAILALSLVAGFSARQDAGCRVNSTEPNSSIVHSKTVNLSIVVAYPYSSAKITVPSDSLRSVEPSTLTPDLAISEKGFMQSAQFLVTWGSFTLFYGVIAIVVYMATTANENIEWFVNFLVLIDLIFHILWVLCWFIASVEWAVAQNGLKNYLNGTLASDQLQNMNCTDKYSFVPGSYVQAAIADVFGFTSVILWLCNLYFVFVDTTFYLKWRASRLGDYRDIGPD